MGRWTAVPSILRGVLSEIVVCAACERGVLLATPTVRSNNETSSKSILILSAI